MLNDVKNIGENSWAKKRMTGHPYSPMFEKSYQQLKGGDLMSSDKGFVSKGLVFVWRTKKQPSGCA